jgi:hypothetical protein
MQAPRQKDAREVTVRTTSRMAGVGIG